MKNNIINEKIRSIKTLIFIWKARNFSFKNFFLLLLIQLYKSHDVAYVKNLIK